MKKFARLLLPPVFLLLTLSACSPGIYVNFKGVGRPNCATASDPLTVQLHNDSKTPISNIYFETTGCPVDFGGLDPGETSCPFPVEPFYSDFDFSITIHRSSMMGNEYTRADVPVDSHRLITEGNYKMSFRLEGRSYKLYLIYFKFEEV